MYECSLSPKIFSVTEKLLRQDLEGCSPPWKPHCWKDADVLKGFVQEQEESKAEDRPLLDRQRTESYLAEQQLERNNDHTLAVYESWYGCSRQYRTQSSWAIENHNWMPGKMKWKKFRWFPDPLKNIIMDNTGISQRWESETDERLLFPFPVSVSFQTINQYVVTCRAKIFRRSK